MALSPHFYIPIGEIHVWTVRLDAGAGYVQAAVRLLRPDEQERAARFRVEHAYRTYVLSRAALRALLSQYIGLDPNAIDVRYGAHGKPELADGAVSFNLSHSGGLTVCAFAVGCDLGVDVERLRPIPRMNSIAQRFFASDEAAYVAQSPEEDRAAAFHHVWTRKEAVIKAVGRGLDMPLTSFSVLGGAGGWRTHSFTPDDGYAGALAYSGPERTVRISSFPIEGWSNTGAIQPL